MGNNPETATPQRARFRLDASDLLYGFFLLSRGAAVLMLLICLNSALGPYVGGPTEGLVAAALAGLVLGVSIAWVSASTSPKPRILRRFVAAVLVAVAVCWPMVSDGNVLLGNPGDLGFYGAIAAVWLLSWMLWFWNPSWVVGWTRLVVGTISVLGILQASTAAIWQLTGPHGVAWGVIATMLWLACGLMVLVTHVLFQLAAEEPSVADSLDDF